MAMTLTIPNTIVSAFHFTTTCETHQRSSKAHKSPHRDRRMGRVGLETDRSNDQNAGLEM